LDVKSLNQIKEISQKNQGISRIIFNDIDDFVVLFSNGSRIGSLSLNRTSYSTPDLLGNELQECEELCQNNEGISQIDIRRNCSETKASSVASACLEYQNDVECLCLNNIKKNILRTVVLPEYEKSRLINSVNNAIWIAPQ
jgi:hypothetical protein